MLICDKCGSGINKESKFCPQCGDPVTEADLPVQPAEKNKVAMVEITFGYSSSANYSKAVSICSKIPTYSLTGEDRQTIHKISLPITEVELIINLFDLVGSWKSSQMLLDGHSATKKHLTYYGVGCFRNRQKAFNPEQFCFGEKVHELNIWGCKRLELPIYEWGGGWLEYGQFDQSGVWHFDKDRIKHELDLKLKENELCPVLNGLMVHETLNKLPATINPKTDKNWEYTTRYEEIKGKYVDVAVGVKPVITKANRYVLGPYKPEWESENGDNFTDHSIPQTQVRQQSSQKKKALQKKKSSPNPLIWLAVVGVLLYVFF